MTAVRATPAGPAAGRVAVVGGGARGIGAALVRMLVASGHTVEVLDAVDGDTLGYPHAAAADVAVLEGDGVRCHAVDLRDADATRAAVDDVAARHGRLDVAASTASVIVGGTPLWETPPEVRDALLAADAATAWNLAAAAVPHLLHRPAHDRPTVAVLTSVAGERGLYGLSAYVVAKHAAVGVVRALAADLVGTAVTAVGVAPGATDTRMLRATADLYGLDDVAPLAEDQQGRTPMTPDEVAAVALHACTAGRVLHGSVLAADGGFGRV
ncbi:SDR family NAD(P)-dependent oxidoreductase [Phycicoccus sp. BSK3Z-2]|uniref:SDR family NAD(P)-dependent oxidoreductase n=1 Tax=Phycicoccus avicenniae TaxID=2828860 RepID=A0A941D8Z4_9MICO|nr:mycofactocin-coupled SDR family oxidoreductase [Phycicoccus avicenniae]MBR7743040.1 SDR family NAD(P)-dependent oxidoreductase [Phycicoccus avicenniae]